MEKFILMIGGLLLASALLFDAGGNDTGLADGSTSETAITASPDARASLPSDSGQFTAIRAPDGHFYAEARVNDAPVRMMVDTGASMVILNPADAERIGFTAHESEFTARANTAGGVVRLKPVTLNRLAVGSLSVDNVPAMIAEEPMAVSLIGQSFLSRVESVEIAGDQIRMR